ncbi:MAG: hypothetical protein IJV34_08460 [Prevotella sp.]|nr:hypothetical protein [Prevotella sp.]
MKRVYIPLQTDIVLLEAQQGLAASIEVEGTTASVEFDNDTEYNGSFGSRRKKSTWEDDDAEEEENYQ